MIYLTYSPRNKVNTLISDLSIAINSTTMLSYIYNCNGVMGAFHDIQRTKMTIRYQLKSELEIKKIKIYLVLL